MNSRTRNQMFNQLELIEQIPDSVTRKFRLIKTFRRLFGDNEPFREWSAQDLHDEILARLIPLKDLRF